MQTINQVTNVLDPQLQGLTFYCWLYRLFEALRLAPSLGFSIQIERS